MRKIRVLYISSEECFCGSTNSLLDMIESVRNEIEPIVLFDKEGEASQLFQSRGIECVIHHIIKIYQLQHPSSLKSLVLHPWRIRFIKHLRADISCALQMRRYFKECKIDIVHSNSAAVTAGVFVSKVLHAKHLWHIREFADLDFHWNIYFGMPILKSIVNKADANIAISSTVGEHWRKDTNAHMYVINDAVCHPDNCEYYLNKNKYVLFVSYTLTEAKGTRFAIEAFAQSKIWQEGYKLVMVGGCSEEYRQSLQTTISQLNINDYVDFIPRQDDVKPYYLNASAYLMTSENEGLGRVTVDAMSYGCPVIGRSSGGTLDLIKANETGYLFSSIDECAALIHQVCHQSNEKMILRAQAFVKENLSLNAYGPKILDVYKKVLAK